MTTLRALVAAIFLVSTGTALAQTDRDEGRGSPAPGTAQDGSRPAEGAIKGGSVLPGESGGLPDAAASTPAARMQRCNQLSGSLREECIAREQGASRGGTRAPDAVNRRADPAAPPPQNPH